MKLEELQKIVTDKVAIRTINRLEPAGGPNSKVFPPTYFGGVYATEKRQIDGEETSCVLLDSVASQANRMEEALQNAIDDEKIKLPLTVIQFDEDSNLVPNHITSLQTPHRIADALFRECKLGDMDFRESDIGKKIFDATPRYATPLFARCPTALLFGMWDSTGPKGGMGSKFERVITSEIVGINATFGVGTASRIDPLISKTDNITVYEKETGGWTLEEKEAKKEGEKPVKYKKKGKLSNVNLGNVAPDIIKYGRDAEGSNPLSNETIKSGDTAANGATIAYAEQTCVISLAALRKLRFPKINGEKATEERNNSARTVLTALGLTAFTLSVEKGLALRSRCTLVNNGDVTWNALKNKDDTMTFALNGTEAINLLNESIKNAEDIGWETEPLVLSPKQNLKDAIKKSQVTDDAGG